MKFSIVVPVYKVEDYLPNCIKSITNQTHSDFELILVDDGSPDRCGHICDQFAARDPRIRVIHKENRGVTSARLCRHLEAQRVQAPGPPEGDEGHLRRRG